MTDALPFYCVIDESAPADEDEFFDCFARLLLSLPEGDESEETESGE